MLTPSVNATLLVSIYAPERQESIAAIQETPAPSASSSAAALTEDTVTLSAEAQEAIQKQETPRAAPARVPDYDIEANLDITTPRPSEESVLSKMSFGGSFLSIRKLTYEEYSALQEKYASAMSSEYQKARYLERHPSPINDTLDQSYKLLEKMIIENGIPRDSDFFKSRLNSIYLKHERLGLHEYANEVIQKRSFEEYGVSLDLGALYQEYLGSEFHGRKINYPVSS
ncbi:MAG: hypothetical protein H6908_02710 [Hyphomicrobiales bacterium]|nr:hypothetical protein [Hyphomicrobiales bacterium]